MRALTTANIVKVELFGTKRVGVLLCIMCYKTNDVNKAIRYNSKFKPFDFKVTQGSMWHAAGGGAREICCCEEGAVERILSSSSSSAAAAAASTSFIWRSNNSQYVLIRSSKSVSHVLYSLYTRRVPIIELICCLGVSVSDPLTEKNWLRCDSRTAKFACSCQRWNRVSDPRPDQGWKISRYFRKYRKYRIFSIFSIFSINIWYFRYFHFTALDWMMSIILKGLCLSCIFQNRATKNNDNSNTALCTTCISRSKNVLKLNNKQYWKLEMSIFAF